MKPPLENPVDVDMVPMIDIVTLLLMFLVIVGDMAASASNIAMKLPRADQAMTDKEMKDKNFRLEGRIIIQMQNQNGVFRAVVNNQAYDLVGGGSNKKLLEYLQKQVDYALDRGLAKKDSSGAVDIPVKLRIPEDAPMRDVERVIMSMARVGLVHVQYAAEPVLKLR